MMSVENSQIREQRLVSARFSGLALQRTDLPLHFFNDVADAQTGLLRSLRVCAALRVFAFCIL